MVGVERGGWSKAPGCYKGFHLRLKTGAIYDKLNTLSGSDFDKEYMEAMTTDRQKALDAFTEEVNTTTTPVSKPPLAAESQL